MSSWTPKIGVIDLTSVDQLSGDKHHQIDRNRETDAFVAARIAGDRGVDANHLTSQIQQRTAAVARVDGGVGLQEILQTDLFGAQFQITPTFGADDAVADGVAQPEGTADRQHEVANFHSVAVADVGR